MTLKSGEAEVSGFLIVVIAILGWMCYSQYNDLQSIKKQLGDSKQTIEEVQARIDALQTENDQLQTRLSDANDEITSAQDEAWTDYENMGSTLESLETK